MLLINEKLTRVILSEQYKTEQNKVKTAVIRDALENTKPALLIHKPS